MWSDEHFWVDLISVISFLESHECIKNALVLEEGSGGIPGPDSAGEGGISAGFRVV